MNILEQPISGIEVLDKQVAHRQKMACAQRVVTKNNFDKRIRQLEMAKMSDQLHENNYEKQIRDELFGINVKTINLRDQRRIVNKYIDRTVEELRKKGDTCLDDSDRALRQVYRTLNKSDTALTRSFTETRLRSIVPRMVYQRDKLLETTLLDEKLPPSRRIDVYVPPLINLQQFRAERRDEFNDKKKKSYHPPKFLLKGATIAGPAPKQEEENDCEREVKTAMSLRAMIARRSLTPFALGNNKDDDDGNNSPLTASDSGENDDVSEVDDGQKSISKESSVILELPAIQASPTRKRGDSVTSLMKMMSSTPRHRPSLFETIKIDLRREPQRSTEDGKFPVVAPKPRFSKANAFTEEVARHGRFFLASSMSYETENEFDQAELNIHNLPYDLEVPRLPEPIKERAKDKFHSHLPLATRTLIDRFRNQSKRIDEAYLTRWKELILLEDKWRLIDIANEKKKKKQKQKTAGDNTSNTPNNRNKKRISLLLGKFKSFTTVPPTPSSSEDSSSDSSS